jgi:hypothetical protein
VARSKALTPVAAVTRAILVLRGHRVLLDAELAALYGVPTKALNQAVKRNAERFPEDFMFRLTRAEVEALNRSQIVTGSQKHRDLRFPPSAFTEHGAIMAATILNSPRAVEMSIYVVRDLVESTYTLRADVLRELLQRCTSVKTVRLCLQLGRDGSLPWVSKLDPATLPKGSNRPWVSRSAEGLLVLKPCG